MARKCASCERVRLRNTLAGTLRRDRRKQPHRISHDWDDPVEEMRQHHPGKMRDWFGDPARWDIVSLDTPTDVSNLVFLESDWSKNEGLVVQDGSDYRLLGRVVENAIAGNYLERPSAFMHKEYYDKLKSGNLRIEGDDRVAICSAELSETSSNPSAKYYLLDGAGRCLPYLMLVTQHLLEFAPIETFRAVR